MWKLLYLRKHFLFCLFFFLMAAAISFNRIKPHCCAPQIPAVISGMRSTFCWPGLEAPLFTCAGLKWPAAYVINLRGFFFLEFMPHQSCSRRPTKYLKGGISVADQCIVNARFPGSLRLAEAGVAQPSVTQHQKGQKQGWWSWVLHCSCPVGCLLLWFGAL